MYQYGGSGYSTSTSTARASVLSVFSTAKFILSFLQFFLKKSRKWNKNYSFVSFFFSVCQNFQEEMEILYRNAYMKILGLKSCQLSLRVEFESCVCGIQRAVHRIVIQLAPVFRSFVAGFVIFISEQFVSLGLHLDLSLMDLSLFATTFFSI
jgi:uncharacterized membrane protein YbaN (DUF454 family)